MTHAVLMPCGSPCDGVQHVNAMHVEAWHVDMFVCSVHDRRACMRAEAVCKVRAASLAGNRVAMSHAAARWDDVQMQHAANPEAWQVECKHADSTF
jgi:hypothetical protein